MDEVTFTEWSI